MTTLGQRAVLAMLVASVALSVAPAPMRARAPSLPAHLTDREFWTTVEAFSEPSGFFNSDNLVSNEDTFQRVVPELAERIAPGGVYVGVGPDQNFTYIAALRPAMAFLVDMRRGNLHAHLMFKALFELSSDRADFLGRLFSRPRPAGLGARSTVAELFAAYRSAAQDERIYDEHLRGVIAHLKRRGFGDVEGDLAGVEYVYSNFFAQGPRLTFVSNRRGPSTAYPTFEALHTSTDGRGVARSYLATEAAFQRVKSLQARNLIVPLVGNFAGTRALAAVAGYVRAREGVVTAFYASNVENYLFQDRIWERFRANLARLPTDRTSTIIRSCFGTCSAPGGSRAVTLLDSIPGLLAEATRGRVQTYRDVLARSVAFP